jgi:hypothetical protein
MTAARARRRETTQTCGTYRGRCYRHVRVSKPHIKSEVWWVLDDGNYFKTLSALIKHIDANRADPGPAIATSRDRE